MYLIRMSWLRGAGTAKTGRDQGQIEGSQENRYHLPEFRGSFEDQVFPWPAVTLGAIQRWMQVHIR